MSYPITFLTAAAGFAADRLLKIKASKTSGSRSILKDKITLKKTTNKGFAMSKCEDRRGLVVVVSIAAFLAVLFLFGVALKDGDSKGKRPGAALLLAGALGNIYDRLRHGFVIDYISIWPLRRIFFNLADVLIAVGAVLYLVL